MSFQLGIDFLGFLGGTMFFQVELCTPSANYVIGEVEIQIW